MSCTSAKEDFTDWMPPNEAYYDRLKATLPARRHNLGEGLLVLRSCVPLVVDHVDFRTYATEIKKGRSHRYYEPTAFVRLKAYIL